MAIATRFPPMEEFYRLRIRSLLSYLVRERMSFLMICFYLFIEYVRPQSIYPELNIVPWAEIALALALITLVLEGKMLRVRGAISGWLLIYCVIALISSWFAYSPDQAILRWPDLFFWVAIYFLIVSVVDTERRVFVFLLLFLLFSFKMAQHGFISWAARGFAFRNWGVTGAPGWFHNSGEFGIQMCVFLPLSLYFITGLYRLWGNWKRLFFAAFPATAALSVVATSSRGALLAVAVVGFWFVWRSRHRMKALVVVAVLAAGMVTLMPDEFAARFDRTGEDKTSQQRLTRWGDGLNIILNHPLTGIGFGNWESYYPQNYHYERLGVGLSHNILIDAAAELGIPGLLVFLMLVLQTLKHNARSREIGRMLQNPFIPAAALGLDGALIGYMVSAQFVSVLYYPYFWINLAFTAALHHVAEQQLAEHRRAVEKEREAEGGAPELPAVTSPRV